MPSAEHYRMLDGRDGVLAVRIIKERDEDPDLSYLRDPGRYEGETPTNRLKYLAQDDARYYGYHRGEWHCIGTWAEADILIDNVTQTIRSGGLWGTESDSEPKYLESIEHDEYGALKTILAKMGFKKFPPFTKARRIDRT